jgi:hypothetical protein
MLVHPAEHPIDHRSHAGRVGRAVHRFTRWRQPACTRAPSDGLGFRGVIQEEHAFVGAQEMAPGLAIR